MKKMKILMIGSDNTVKGGITSVITQLLNYEWEKENIKMKFLPTYIDKNIIKRAIFFLNAYAKFLYLLITYHPNLIHIHMSHNGSFYRKYMIHRLCKLLRIKHIIHLHSSSFNIFYSNSSERNKKRIKKFFYECDAILVLGERWRNNILNIQPKANTIILNNTVELPKIYSKKERIDINILFLGVLVKRKGVNDLLRSISNLNKKNILNDYNVKLKIGGTGEDAKELKSYVEYNSLEKYVEFLGWITSEEKQKYLRNSDIFVLPSYNEGLPIAILEAISYGLPVISTTVGSIDEAVIDNYNGYLIEPGDIKSMDDKLEKIIKDTELRSIFSENSKKLASEKFDEKVYFNNVKLIYKNILK